MYRENIFEFMGNNPRVLFIPQNRRMFDYVTTLLPKIGLDVADELQDQRDRNGTGSIYACGLEIVLERAEDIPQKVESCLLRGIDTYGLTGDDLFDEGRLRRMNEGPNVMYFVNSWLKDIRNGPEVIEVINTYDWFDKDAKFKRPALCLINKTGKVEDIPERANVAICGKYEMTSQRYLERSPLVKGKNLQPNQYTGQLEKSVFEGKNDCCIDIVNSGGTYKKYGLQVADIVRFSDIVLIGENKNIFGDFIMRDYNNVKRRSENPKKGSYTTNLLSDRKKWRDKLITEAGEVFSAIEGNGNIVSEVNDLIYALNVAIVGEKIEPWQIYQEMGMRLK
tara:strand:- start:4040 stop:5047 length:1008 start_codon:yes stop_codon:yes gene_type:complete